MIKSDGYYLIFMESKNPFIRLFLKKGFGHIVIATATGYGDSWLLIDPHESKLSADVVSEDDLNYFMNDKRVIYVRTGVHLNNLFSLKFATCVNIARYITGLKVRGITPWRLYKNLYKLVGLKRKPVYNLHELRIVK